MYVDEDCKENDQLSLFKCRYKLRSITDVSLERIQRNYKIIFGTLNVVPTDYQYQDLIQWVDAQPQLVSGSGANSFVAIAEDVILKFEKPGDDQGDRDPLIHDALYSYILTDKLNETEAMKQYQKHFALFKLFTRVKDPEICGSGKRLNLINALKVETVDLSNRMDPLCLITEKVPNPTDFEDTHNIFKDNGGNISIFKDCTIKLLEAVAELAEATSFTHGDMHPGNILWNTKHNCFQLIDFGRSMMDPSKPEGVQSIQAFSERFMKPLGLNSNDLKLSPMRRRLTMKYAADPQLKLLGAALDIGGLLWWIQTHPYMQELTNMLKNDVYLNNIIQLNTCIYIHGENMMLDLNKLDEELEKIPQVFTADPTPLQKCATVYIRALDILHMHVSATSSKQADNKYIIDRYFFPSGIWLPYAYTAFARGWSWEKDAPSENLRVAVNSGGSNHYRCRRRVLKVDTKYKRQRQSAGTSTVNEMTITNAISSTIGGATVSNNERHGLLKISPPYQASDDLHQLTDQNQIITSGLPEDDSDQGTSAFALHTR